MDFSRIVCGLKTYKDSFNYFSNIALRQGWEGCRMLWWIWTCFGDISRKFFAFDVIEFEEKSSTKIAPEVETQKTFEKSTHEKLPTRTNANQPYLLYDMCLNSKTSWVPIAGTTCVFDLFLKFNFCSINFSLLTAHLFPNPVIALKQQLV